MKWFIGKLLQCIYMQVHVILLLEYTESNFFNDSANLKQTTTLFK